MIKQPVHNPKEELISNNKPYCGNSHHERRLKSTSENSTKVSYIESLTPVLKYHTKSLPSSSFELTSSQERIVDQLPPSIPEQTVLFDPIALKEGFQDPTVNGCLNVNEDLTKSKNLCNSLIFIEKSAKFDTSSFLSVPTVVSNSNTSRIGLTGSLLTPARLKAKQPTNSMLSDHSGLLHTTNKNRQKINFNRKLASHSSQFPVNNLSTFTFQQKKWLSSSILPRHDRPSSAKQNTAACDSKATNTFNSYVSKSDSFLNKAVLQTAGCSPIGNTTQRLSRPKSSYRQRLMNSHNIARPNNSNLCVENKTSNQSISGLCIVSQSSFSDSALNSARSVGLLKKLKPVDPDLSKTKPLCKNRVNGLNKLNLAMKSSSLSNGNTYNSVKDQSDSSPSLYDSSGISSSCSSCLESKTDSTGKSGSKVNLDKIRQSNYSSKNKKIRPSTAPKKTKKKTTDFHDINSKKKVLGSTVSKIQEASSSYAPVNAAEASQQSNLSEEISLQSTRTCGDGIDLINKEESKIIEHDSLFNAFKNRLPGDGIECSIDEKNEGCFSHDFSYEDSLLDANDVDVEEDCSNEIIEDMESCPGSDIATGEFVCDDDDALDCIDDSTVASLDEDYAGSEFAESESSGMEGFYISPTNETLDEDKKPAIIKSIFSNCPAVINFSTKLETIESLPPSIRKLLKWKMSTITPIVVRNTVMRSGFKPSKKNHDWMGYFGKHMKSNGFRSLREYQKINHFPGSFQLGRKDRLWRNMSRMQTRYGKKEFGFVPRSYVLPWDKKLLKNAWEEGGTKQKYILKPPASARGIGIKVIHKWNQIPSRKPIMVQKYLSRPYLINGSKFDLRLYVHVTSFDPLRIYLFDDGLVRFATCKYSSSMKHLSNKFMHLTNYSINKKSGVFEQNDNASICQGHKWSLKALWGYMQQKGINTDKIWEQMKDVVIKTIISVEQFTNSLVKSNCRRRYCCHELFGFDIMLDDRLRPWLLEVNISPSLHSNSPLDVQIKGAMVKDMFNLCGFHLPDKKRISGNAPSTSGSSVPSAAASFSQDKRKQGVEVTSDSRAKHSYFAQHYKTMDEQALTSLLLDTLTVNDIRMLVEGEDEAARRGNFQKIFPCLNKKYLRFFEQPRYYNELLYAWELRFNRQANKGHELLESFCRRGLHLHEVVSDPSNIPYENVWNPNFMNHPKVAPSPRIDSKITLSHSKQVNNPHFTFHSPTIVSSSIVNSRSRSAKPYRTRSEDGATSSMLISSKPINPLLVINADA